MVAFRGGMPLGSLAVGSLASATSAPTALAVSGVGLVGVSVWFLAQGKRRQELVARGAARRGSCPIAFSRRSRCSGFSR